MNWYRSNPAARMWTRAIAFAVLGYLVKVFGSGADAFELSPFLWGLGSAVVYAIVGAMSPLEPMVGVKARVDVPAASLGEVKRD